MERRWFLHAGQAEDTPKEGLTQTQAELGDLVSFQAPWSSLWQLTPSSWIFCSQSCSHSAMAAIGAWLCAAPHLKKGDKPTPGRGHSPQARVTCSLCSFCFHHAQEGAGSSSV